MGMDSRSATPISPKLYIFFGLIASGKSTLAEAWAATIGARYYNSDRLRKELAGLAAHTPQRDAFQGGIYSAEFSRKTYDALLARAEADIVDGHTVVLDGSYQAKDERWRVQQLAQRCKITAVFVLCLCPEPLMRERMALRAQDPSAVSDGRWEIYLQQKARFAMPDELAAAELVTIETNAPVASLVQQLSGTMVNRKPYQGGDELSPFADRFPGRHPV